MNTAGRFVANRLRLKLGSVVSRLTSALGGLQPALNLSSFTLQPISYRLFHLKSLRVFLVELQQPNKHPGFSVNSCLSTSHARLIEA